VVSVARCLGRQSGKSAVARHAKAGMRTAVHNGGL